MPSRRATQAHGMVVSDRICFQWTESMRLPLRSSARGGKKMAQNEVRSERDSTAALGNTPTTHSYLRGGLKPAAVRLQVAKVLRQLDFEFGGKCFHLLTLERHFAHALFVL